jgi:CheY-like chemotaxis protein
MAIDPLPSNYYRFQFREFLQSRAESTPAQPESNQDIIIADVFQKEPPMLQTIPAPQDLGEMKRSFRGDTAPQVESGINEIELKTVEPKDDRWLSDSSSKYSILAQFGIPEPIREEMEIEVRRLKKSGRPCPHRDNNSFCSALFIRCGERRQFAIKETREQKNLAHHCKYIPQSTGDYVLIVDNDKTIREFCRTTLEIFFSYSEEKIVTVESAGRAIDALNRIKQENRLCGLALIDSDLPGKSGYELVNELYLRNFNVDVIMMSGQVPHFTKPPGFLGDREIIPHKAIVVSAITKPFHSEALIELLQSLSLKPQT